MPRTAMLPFLCHLATILSIGLGTACSDASGRGSAAAVSDSVEVAAEPAAAIQSQRPRRASNFRHIRTMVTDFYYNWTPRARDITAARFDMVIGGNINEWKRRNPNVQTLTYRLHWSIMQPGQRNDEYARLEQWYRRNPECNIENAFLHRPGTSRTRENRLETRIWTSNRWMFNPMDACWRRYQLELVRALKQQGADGVFYDEYGTGTMGPASRSLELGNDPAAYHRAITEVLRAERREMGDDFLIMLNTAEYVSPADATMIDVAGGAHLELFNDLLHGDMASRWSFIEARLNAGAVIEMVGRKNWRYPLPGSVTPGNYRDAFRDGFPAPGMYRQKMGELVSYYMVRPVDPSNLYFDTNNDNWQQPPTAHWLEAQTVDVGDPTERRRQVVDTRGSDGQRVRIYQRMYTNALMLARPSADWEDRGFGDESGYTYTLPAGDWHLLHHDGSTGPAIRSIVLRKGEGAILMKGSAIRTSGQR